MVMLEFVWDWLRGDNDSDRDLLERLKPHPNLKRLGIDGYRGRTFPGRFDSDVSSSLLFLIEITIEDCSNLEHLPSSLGGFPLLRRLVIQNVRSAKLFLANNSDDAENAFPSLEYLEIVDMEELEDWFPGGRTGVNSNSKHIIHHFPGLKELQIRDFPELKRLPPSLSSSLQELELHNCNPMILGLIQNLPTLSSLNIYSIEDLLSFPEESLQNLPSLKSLYICECECLQTLSSLMGITSPTYMFIYSCPSLTNVSLALRHQTSLRSLSIQGCRKAEISAVEHQYLSSRQSLIIEGFDEMTASPDGIQHLSSTLRQLVICDWSALNSLPDWIGSFTNLKPLYLWDCKNLTSLPAGIQRLGNLQFISIMKCHPEVHRRCKRETGEDWPKIRHIPGFYNLPAF